jgi:hypothetical protein
LSFQLCPPNSAFPLPLTLMTFSNTRLERGRSAFPSASRTPVCQCLGQDIKSEHDERCTDGMAGGASAMRTITIKRTWTQGPGKHDNVEQSGFRVSRSSDEHGADISPASCADQTSGTISNNLRSGIAFTVQRCWVDVRPLPDMPNKGNNSLPAIRALGLPGGDSTGGCWLARHPHRLKSISTSE